MVPIRVTAEDIRKRVVETRRKAISEHTQVGFKNTKPAVDSTEMTVWDWCVDEEPSTAINNIEDTKCKSFLVVI